MAVIALNCLFITAGFALLELLPVYMKNHAGVSERGVGLVFFANTIVIVVAQMPIARVAEGRRRMSMLMALGVVWATAHALTPVIGSLSSGVAATALFAGALGVFAIGECIHGAVQAPLVTDLARPDLIGRYMALSAFSWQVGFTIGPAAGGFLLAAMPNGVWGLAGGPLSRSRRRVAHARIVDPARGAALTPARGRDHGGAAVQCVGTCASTSPSVPMARPTLRIRRNRSRLPGEAAETRAADPGAHR